MEINIYNNSHSYNLCNLLFFWILLIWVYVVVLMFWHASLFAIFYGILFCLMLSLYLYSAMWLANLYFASSSFSLTWVKYWYFSCHYGQEMRVCVDVGTYKCQHPTAAAVNNSGSSNTSIERKSIRCLKRPWHRIQIVGEY